MRSKNKPQNFFTTGKKNYSKETQYNNFRSDFHYFHALLSQKYMNFFI